ncbi:MAG TPA: fumarylacetoacetate hydrolase family protein [bacterium]|nr:fumarylacetoacetate hydrolase family protein [bacterium]
MDDHLTALADWLDERLPLAEPVPEILERAPALTATEAYRIQAALMDRHVARGDRIVGYKAALTSKAMQEMAGVGEPLLGTLLASRVFPEAEPIALGGFLKATLEPEVAVLLRGELRGPGVTPLDALAAVAGYLPAVELGDYRTGENARSLQQTLVCNTFSGGIVLGGPLSAPAGLDLRTEGMVLTRNGEVCGSATCVEVLGDPLRSVAFMANKLAEQGGWLRPGMVLMTGSIVRSIPLAPGDEVRVDFTRLGTLHLRCAD